MGPSRHDGGSDVLTSPGDLYVALGVRLRERPGSRWVVEMHPETSAGFDVDEFRRCCGSQEVSFQDSGAVAPGEFRLTQRGFASAEDDEPGARPRRSGAHAPNDPA